MILPLRLVARGLEAALGEEAVYGSDGHAEPDLLGIDAPLVLLGFGRARDGLREHVLKGHPASLKTIGVNVGDVIADNIHPCLVVLKTGNSGIQ